MESLTPLPPLKNLQGASPSSKVIPLTFQPHSPKERPGLGTMKHTKPKTHDSLKKSVSGTITVCETEPTTPSFPTKVNDAKQESKINKLTKLIQMLIDEKILKAKAKPFPPCTHCGFNDHRPDDCRNYPKYGICGSYDYFTLGHNHVIHIRGGVLAESSQSSETSNGVKCNTCGSTIHSTTDHNEFDNFKRGTIFNANNELVLIAPRRNDVYVLDMSSLTPNGACFFAKASKSINWLWHKRLLHLNFKNINKLAKQNKFLGLPSQVYSKDKPCSPCEKGKHHKASFKTKQNFSTRKYLHLLHMDLLGPLESFCDKKGIFQNFSSPYTPEQNGIAERKNRTLIEAARTMLNGSVLSKHFWTKAVRIACYTQNRSIIVKRHDKTPYEIFRERIPDISYFHMFGCPVFIHNHKDHLGKFDAKADDGYFLGYSFVSKAFRVFNTRRQQVEETYHVTFDEMIAPNEPDIPLIEDNGGPLDLINTEGTHEQNFLISLSLTYLIKPLQVLILLLKIDCQKTTGEGMLTRSMAAKLTTASASECLFTDFLSEIELKKEEEIHYDETFAPVARMEAIRIFFAFATYMNFKVFQMDVKSAFLNGKLKDVYAKQPPRFESSEFPDYVCKLYKALYGLKQAPMAWYKTLSTLLILNKFIRARIDNTLFIYKSKGDVLLVQVSSVKTCMVPLNNLGPDLAGKPVNETLYRGMIGSLMYLKGTPTLSLYYPKCSGFDLKGYSDSYYSAKKQQSVAMSLAAAEYVVAAGCCASTDIAKILRKWSKPDKHEHGNGIECAKVGECYQ
ncbi:retrovirus-related pol polyprotein from transposon TNT 1-94, partial [Tanacetum coccineum]